MEHTESKAPQNGEVTEALRDLKNVADQAQSNVTKMPPSKPETVQITEGEQGLLQDAAERVTDLEGQLGKLRARYLREERLLEQALEQARTDATVLLDFVSKRHLKGAEGTWDYSPEAGGFIRTKE